LCRETVGSISVRSAESLFFLFSTLIYSLLISSRRGIQFSLPRARVFVAHLGHRGQEDDALCELRLVDEADLGEYFEDAAQLFWRDAELAGEPGFVRVVVHVDTRVEARAGAAVLGGGLQQAAKAGVGQRADLTFREEQARVVPQRSAMFKPSHVSYRRGGCLVLGYRSLDPSGVCYIELNPKPPRSLDDFVDLAEVHRPGADVAECLH